MIITISLGMFSKTKNKLTKQFTARRRNSMEKQTQGLQTNFKMSESEGLFDQKLHQKVMMRLQKAK